MLKKYNIELNIKSGSKYITDYGFSAIKDGIKNKKNRVQVNKPLWLKVQKPNYKKYFKIKSILKKYRLSTVCEEAICPNINECWSNGVATIMLMGKICSRACKFCSVDTGNMNGLLDYNEPLNTAKSIFDMNLKYVVLTSVNRDDIIDGGANHYANTIKCIQNFNKNIKIEALIPDFGGIKNNIDKIIDTKVDVIAHNIETVYRLTNKVRDPRAGYWQTLNLLKYIKDKSPNIFTKTSIMLGLGEYDYEIYQTMDDARNAGVDIITLGQYMQPTKNHLNVDRFITPKEFIKYREIGLKKGFLEVASGPLVRSSYRADRLFNKNNLDL